jgi:hypothetical protein
MDPYLEAPEIRPDLHHALAGEIRNELNRTLPNPYYAHLEMREEPGNIEQGGTKTRIVPDMPSVPLAFNRQWNRTPLVHQK